MSSPAWPPLPPYDRWAATCDTLHAHAQVLGKLAAALASAGCPLELLRQIVL